MRTPEELRKAYEDGMSIEDLAFEEHMGVQTMRRVLGRLDVTIRDPDERVDDDRFINRPTHKPDVERPTGVHKAKQRRKGYRRRGRI
jgi:hypothetical protein